MKDKFIILYDYETGGAWGTVLAQSKQDILEKFPELTIVDERPEWMNSSEFDEICSQKPVDIDNVTGWLKILKDTR